MNKGIARQWLFIIALLVSVSFLSVVFGMAAHKLKLWPFPIFQDAYQATKAWRERLMNRSRYDGTNLFIKVRHTNNGGILRYNKEKAYSGFTLFTSVHAQKALLISMEGQIVHEWHLPFSSIWKNPPHIRFPVSEDFIYWGKAYLYPNGDLIVTIKGLGDTPWGYGLVKMDKDSRIIWKYAEHAHHDVNVGSDGKIYTLIHDFTTEKMQGIKLKPPFLDDSIVVLSADGHELKRLSLLKAFRHSDFSNVLNVLGETITQWDPWHTNNVEVLDERMAEQFPFLKKGQVLISMRDIDTIAVVDLDKERVVWATTGPWHRQHDPDFLSNGNMLIFDNRGHYGKGGKSRIIEFNPMTMEIIWQYVGNEQGIFSSVVKGAQQRLPNGNTLITESLQGRIFEVTREKEIVWEFSSPFRAADDNQLVANVWWGQRFHPDSLTFEFSNLNQNTP
jgi:outer membrane protein assembly factor BamB